MPRGAIGPGSMVASRFRLEDLLEGHSGASFWRATDLTLARNVAIHVIDVEDPRAAAVLVAARTSATVSDGRILRVLDALEEDGFVHVVHEWGTGVSLDRMIADDLVEPRRAAWLVREVAEAITVAHRQGIAHGRLLPENVLLTDAGTVKLIGFVVGAVLHGRPPRPGSAEPPPSEHESDIRNLGGLLYACVTGKWPGFPESCLPDAPLDHGRVCRPRQVRSGIPKQLDALCDELINPDARTGRARYETAADVAAALGAYLGDTLATTPLPVAGPTAFLDLDGLVDPLEHTDEDPEATQPGLPRFGDTSPGLSSAAIAATAEHDEVPDGSEPGADGSPTATDASAVPAAPAEPSGSPAGNGEAGGDRAGGRAQERDSQPRRDRNRERPKARPKDRPRDRDRDRPRDRDRDRERDRDKATRRETARDTGRVTGMGNGAVPAYWGPDRPTDTGSTPAVREERPGAPWLRLAAVVGVLALVLLAVLVGFYLGRTDPDDQAGTDGQDDNGQPAVIAVAEVTDFDPDDPNDEENPDQAPLAVDQDAETAWQTKTYFDGPALAPYRSGVGLLLDLGSEQEVGTVQLTLGGGPYDVELLATPEGTGTPPTSPDGLVDVAARRDVSDEVALGGDETVVTRYLVVWLTALPPTEGGYRGEISEIEVRS